MKLMYSQPTLECLYDSPLPLVASTLTGSPKRRIDDSFTSAQICSYGQTLHIKQAKELINE